MAVAPAEPAVAPVAPPVAAPAPAPVAAPAAQSILDLAPKPPVDPAAPPAPANDGKLILKERPAYLAEPFYDAKTGEVRLEALAKAQTDLRAQITRADHKPPATAADYKLDFANHADPDIKRAAAAMIAPAVDGSPDPVMKAVSEAAHKTGVSQVGLQTIVETFLKEQAALLPPPMDEAAEMTKLGQHGPALLKNLNDFADQEVKYGNWDEADREKFRTYLYDAGDALFLQKILQASGRIPEVQIAHAQQAAAAPDNAAIDAEQAQLDKDFREGKITDAQATERMAAINEKRKAIMGNAETRQWPPPR